MKVDSPWQEEGRRASCRHTGLSLWSKNKEMEEGKKMRNVLPSLWLLLWSGNKEKRSEIFCLHCDCYCDQKTRGGRTKKESHCDCYCGVLCVSEFMYGNPQTQGNGVWNPHQQYPGVGRGGKFWSSSEHCHSFLSALVCLRVFIV